MRNCPIRFCFAFIALAFGMGAQGQDEERPSQTAGVAASGTPVQKPKDDRIEIRVEKLEIEPSVEYELSRAVGAGRIVLGQEAIPGVIVKTFECHWQRGNMVSKKMLKEQRADPQNAIYLIGSAGYGGASRHRFGRGRVVTMVATAYDPSKATIGPRATGHTFTGMKAGFGVVAVDPRVIALGTLVFVEGYGFAIASDIGSAIKGNRIDLCYPLRETSLRYGKKKVVVHILQ